MFTGLDKAWAGLISAGVMMEVVKYIPLNENLETGLVALLTAVIVYFVPNK